MLSYQIKRPMIVPAIMQFEENFDERQFYLQQLVKTYKLLERKQNSRNYHLTEKGIAFEGFDTMRNADRLNQGGKRKTSLV